eukprot:TRINITY_DN20483_c0_g1_i2.p1 TRINITY_DN20483_c0_g1~~TRINITY_DN20483_c0_g1_i2.p1  ORF type:complete len:215 (-),score=44.30 TRINITY_DN20483_c0_g1_i2:182-826(-)
MPFPIFFFLMIRDPPRSPLSSSSAASDVYKRQEPDEQPNALCPEDEEEGLELTADKIAEDDRPPATAFSPHPTLHQPLEEEDLEAPDQGLHSRQPEEKVALSNRAGLRDDLSVTWDDVPCVRLYRGMKAWRDPRSGKGIPRRPVCLGFCLFVTGVVFTVVFLAGCFAWGLGAAIPYGVVGAIALMPGCYVMLVTYKAYHHEPGYDFGQIRAPGD